MENPFGNLAVPVLQSGQRIAEWELLFRAAVAPLLAQKAGEKLAINLLPAYVCRRPAEVKVVTQIVSCCEMTLDEAFETLKELDPPIDSSQAMITMCRQDWEPGKPIDDFFYGLVIASEMAKTPLNMPCILLVNQLPTAIQGSMREWVENHTDISMKECRVFIKRIRELLTEKGIPLDEGNRDFKRVGELKHVSNKESIRQSYNSGGGAVSIVSEGIAELSQEESVSKLINVDSTHRVKHGFQRFRGRSKTSGYTREMRCFNCGRVGHFARECQPSVLSTVW